MILVRRLLPVPTLNSEWGDPTPYSALNGTRKMGADDVYASSAPTRNRTILASQRRPTIASVIDDGARQPLLPEPPEGL